MTTIENKDNQRAGLIVSIAVHAVLILIFFFVTFMKEQVGEGSSPGVALNFGYDEVGSGDVQTYDHAADEAVEDVAPNVDPPSGDENSQNIATSALDEAPNIDQKEKKEVKNPVTNNKDNKKENKSDNTTKKQTVDNKNLYPTGAGEGDDNEKGNKGDERGDLKGDQYKGDPGNGGNTFGNGFDKYGWEWKNVPDKETPIQEFGTAYYKVTINDAGKVLEVEYLRGPFSEKNIKFYEALIYKSYFTPKAGIKPKQVYTEEVSIKIKPS